VIPVWYKWHNFWLRCRIPGVRQYKVQFEIDLRSWAIGVMYYKVGFALDAGPIAIKLERRCDCCP
jgi:hypothetical protein